MISLDDDRKSIWCSQSSRCEFNEFTIPADVELEIDLNKLPKTTMRRGWREKGRRVDVVLSMFGIWPAFFRLECCVLSLRQPVPASSPLCIWFKVSTTRHRLFYVEQVLASLFTHISLSMRLLTSAAIYRLDTSRCLSSKVSGLF